MIRLRGLENNLKNDNSMGPYKIVWPGKNIKNIKSMCLFIRDSIVCCDINLSLNMSNKKNVYIILVNYVIQCHPNLVL